MKVIFITDRDIRWSRIDWNWPIIWYWLTVFIEKWTFTYVLMLRFCRFLWFKGIRDLILQQWKKCPSFMQKITPNSWKRWRLRTLRHLPQKCRNVRRFLPSKTSFNGLVNVGEYTDCPVFDGLFEFCQMTTGASIGRTSSRSEGSTFNARRWSY